MIWSRKFAILGVILSIFAVVVATQQVQKYQSLKIGAAADAAELFFNPASDSVTTTEKVFPIWINAAVGVSFARVELTFDPAVLTLTKDPSIVSTVLTQTAEITPFATANSTGKIVVAVGQAPNTTTPSGTFQLASLTFKAKSTTNSNSSVTISTTNSQLVNSSAIAFALTSTPLSLVLNPVIASTGATLYFSTPIPANPQVVNVPFTTDIMMDTASQDTYGVDAVVKYDVTKLRLNTITPTSGNGFSSYPLSNIDNVTGTAKFSANIGSAINAAAVNGSSISIAKLSFTTLAATTGVNLAYDFTAGNRNDSNIIFKNANAAQDPMDILTTATPLSIVSNIPSSSPSPSVSPSPSPSPSVSPSPSPSPSVSPSPSPSPSVSPSPTASDITFNFNFQGKTRSEASKSAAIIFTYKKDNQTTPTTLNIITDNSGKMTTSLLPGNYVFLVKSPGYLARRFATSTAPIAIGPGIMTIDFTNSPLLGGDLNLDGLINEIDYTLGFLPYFGSSNIEGSISTGIADLDSSGQVNNLDFSIMRGNWNLANDIYQ